MFWIFEDKIVNINAVDVIQFDTSNFYPSICFSGNGVDVKHEIKRTDKYLRPSHHDDENYNEDMYKWYREFIFKAFLLGKYSEETSCVYEEKLSLKALIKSITMHGELFNSIETAINNFKNNGVVVENIKIFTDIGESIGKSFTLHLFTIVMNSEDDMVRISILDELMNTYYLEDYEVCGLYDCYVEENLVSCFVDEVRKNTFLNVSFEDMKRN